MRLSDYGVRASIAVSDERGIHELGDGRVAWFEDPDRNTFAIEQDGTP